MSKTEQRSQARGRIALVLMDNLGIHTPKGSLLLQVRAKVLNDELAEVFKRWYPAFGAPTESAVTEELPATSHGFVRSPTATGTQPQS